MKKFSKFKRTLKVLITSVFSTLACVGIIYAASTIGANITTTGTLTVTGDATFDTNTLYVDSTNNRVGIGTASPYGTLHVKTATAPTLIPTWQADDLVIENDDSVGISLLSASTSVASIYFGDILSVTTGGILYNHNDDSLSFRTNQSEQFRVDNSGNLGIGTTTPQYKLDVYGDINIRGNDTFKINGETVLSASSTRGNIYLGRNVGVSNTTGSENVFIGNDAGELNTSGIRNTYLGSEAGDANTTGDDNVFIGSASAKSNLTGLRNVFVGKSSGELSNAGSDNIFLGYMAGYSETGSNKLYVTNSNTSATSTLIYGEFDNNLLSFNASVGIGTSTPATELEVHGSATTTISVMSEGGALKGGRIILEDSDGAGCTEIYVLNGVITSATVTCPSN